MAVLLHVQGSGRDPLRPFGGHAIRTISWDRFDPAEVERDVETIVLSPAEPVSVGNVVSILHAGGAPQRILIVPGEGQAWREFSGVQLPGADVVLGGITGLPDYLMPPEASRDSGPRRVSERTADVIDLRVPRGPGRSMLYERMRGQGPKVASAMRSWAFDVTGENPADHPLAETTSTAVVEDIEPALSVLPPRPPDRPTTAPDTRSDPDAAEVSFHEVFSRPVVVHEAPPAPRPAPESEPPRSRRGHTPGSPSEARAEPAPEMSGRRLARSLEDPTVLVPAALAQVDRLIDAARTPRALAEYLLDHIGADAVEVLAPQGSAWHTEVTVGECSGAGTVTDIVDVPGLVAWLESSFDSPVVLDGSDLGAEGSWVLAAPARHADRTVGLILAWRRPGRSIFDPAAVTAVEEVRDDAAASLELATAVRRLARALAPAAD